MRTNKNKYLNLKKSLNEGIKPHDHEFTCKVISLSIELFRKGLGYKQIESVFEALEPYLTKKGPSDSVIRQWMMRMGFFKLHEPLPEGEWMMLGDETVDIGTIKCLVTLAVDINKLHERGDYTLSSKDLVIAGIHPTESSTGEFLYQAFQEGLNRLGGMDAVVGLVIDQASNIKKGASFLQAANTKIKVLHDIPHKLSLVLEKELKNNEEWIAYTLQLTKTKLLTQQTDLAALQPPRQRGKARFMNIALYIKWPDKFLEAKANGNLDEIPEERYQQYFGWLSNYSRHIVIWGQMVGVVEMIKETIRQHGLSKDAYNYLLASVAEMPLEKEVEGFICKVFATINEEVEKLDEGQILPSSTEIAESTFGSYKYHSARGGHGITGNALTIGLLVGKIPTLEEICQALEATPVSKMLKWVNEKIGNTLSKVRSKFFLKNKFAGKPATT